MMSTEKEVIEKVLGLDFSPKSFSAQAKACCVTLSVLQSQNRELSLEGVLEKEGMAYLQFEQKVIDFLRTVEATKETPLGKSLATAKIQTFRVFNEANIPFLSEQDLWDILGEEIEQQCFSIQEEIQSGTFENISGLLELFSQADILWANISDELSLDEESLEGAYLQEIGTEAILWMEEGDLPRILEIFSNAYTQEFCISFENTGATVLEFCKDLIDIMYQLFNQEWDGYRENLEKNYKEQVSGFEDSKNKGENYLEQMKYVCQFCNSFQSWVIEGKVLDAVKEDEIMDYYEKLDETFKNFFFDRLDSAQMAGFRAKHFALLNSWSE